MFTPMMLQYLEVKEKYKDAILFYRLGDFYEMFFDDAKTVSRELELTLTGKSCGETERAPMCGVPFHAADQYIGRLVAKGYKVVVCEQVEDPATAKGLVQRDVVRIVTPGTQIDTAQLDERKNNYMVSVFYDENILSAAFADISTGEISCSFFEGPERESALVDSLAVFSPTEAICNISLSFLPKTESFLRDRMNAFVTDNDFPRFNFDSCLSLIKKQFGDEEANRCRETNVSLICSVGALISYIRETQMTENINLQSLKIQNNGQFLELDTATRRNLEITETMRSREKKGSLLWVLDRTKTAAGGRMLRRWVEQPLVNANAINRRLSAVGELRGAYMLREELADRLRSVLDLDRLMTKTVYGTANAKDLRAIYQTASILPDIKNLTEEFTSPELRAIHDGLDTLDDISELIDRAIVEEPPFSLREGGFIRENYNAEVDELTHIVKDAKGFIEEIAEKEREATGIKSLKIGYNRVFGYYIEISNSFISQVPENYIRKQTLVGGERYITPELKEKEQMIEGASGRLIALEYELFCSVREAVNSQISRIQETSNLLAALDCYISLADAAEKNQYVCPEVDYGNEIVIRDGRHPVVEQFSKGDYFVPNDTRLDVDRNKLMLITGPNMAGKSTYMRQVALITLMAQIGSFVPAAEARIGIADKIFTRVGASDDLSQGTSTFMLEMIEVAYILKNATVRSLVIFDEVGRGTSTFDGMSIARAVAEYTAKKIGCKTMFATHYHELTELENEIPGVVNYNIAAKKKADDIIFLRKIVRGGTDDSYGIEVAKLAGVPKEVIKRAREVLKQIESDNAPTVVYGSPESEVSMEDIRAGEVRDRLRNLDLNIITPLDALNLLVELKKIVE